MLWVYLALAFVTFAAVGNMVRLGHKRHHDAYLAEKQTAASGGACVRAVLCAACVRLLTPFPPPCATAWRSAPVTATLSPPLTPSSATSSERIRRGPYVRRRDGGTDCTCRVRVRPCVEQG